MAASPPQCVACLSFDLSLVGGALVCDICGTQSNAFIEEATEYAATDGRRRVRAPGVAAPARAAANAAAAAAAAARPPAAAFVLANVRCMQRVLMAQAAALSTTLSTGPPRAPFLSLTGRIWHAHLARSGLLEPAAHTDLAAVVARPARAPTAAADAEVVAAAADAAGRLVAPVAGPPALLSICALALWLWRAPVTPADLVRWAGRGELPYLDVSAYAAAADGGGGARLVTCPALLRPPGLPAPAALAAGAARLSASLGGLGAHLSAPSTPLLRRWLFELGAPQALLPVAVEVAATAGRAARARGGGDAAAADDLLSPAAAPDTLSTDARRYPFLGPLAALAVAFKLAYGLGVEDGQGGGGNGGSSSSSSSPPVLPGLPPPPPAGWAAWAAGVVDASMAAPLGTPPTAGAAAGLSPSEARAYVAWVGEAVFPAAASGSGAGATAAGPDAAAAAPWEAAAAALARAGAEAQRHSGHPTQVVAPAPAPRRRAPAKQAAAATTTTTTPPTWPYAPPAHPDRLTTSLPPAYAAVLTALAAHGWVKPAALLAAAAAIEAALLDAEAGVDKV